MQIKKLLKNTDNVIIAMLLFLLFVLLVLVVFVSNKKFEYIGKSEIEVDTLMPTIELKFNNPINTEDIVGLREKIQIMPELDFNIRVVGNKLFINIQENLLSNSEYKIKIDKDFENVFFESLKNDYEINLKTKSQKFAYIHREADKEDESIMLYDIDNEVSSTILKGGKYSKLSGYGEKLIIVKNYNSFYEDIIVIDLSNSEVDVLGLENRKIKDLVYSEKYKTIIFSSYPVDENGFVTNVSELFTYNLDILSLINHSDIFQEIDEPSQLILSSDNRTLLLRDDRSLNYYLLDILDTKKKPVLLGKYAQAGGFNEKGDKLIFSRFDYVQKTQEIVILEDKVEKVIKLDEPIIDPIISSSSYFYSKEIGKRETGRPIFNLHECNFENECTNIIIDSENSYENISKSKDSRYLLIEKYLPEQLDNLSLTRASQIVSKPYYGNQSLYSISDQQLIFEAIGLEVVWL